MRIGDTYVSAAREVVMYVGAGVDDDGKHYLIQRFGGKVDKIDPQYFHKWYIKVYSEVQHG